MTKSIAVAGKGGTGKTTIAALIIQDLCGRKKGPVLAIDADADANLGTMLGIAAGKTVGDLREDVLKAFKNFPAGMSRAQYVEAGLHQIVDEGDGFDLISMGRGEGGGCYCYLNSLIRKFSDDLMPEYPWVVIDNEAGLEHISRRTSTNIDSLLIVVGHNPISLNTAHTIYNITNTISPAIRHRYLVTNMVPPERLDSVHERLADIPLEIIADIPPDPAVQDTLFSGGSLKELSGTPANKTIQSLIDKLGG